MNNIRILIVEDIKINQVVVINYLKKLGYTNIKMTSDGIECLDALCKNEYDVFICDVEIPFINGEKITEYLIDYYIANNKGSYIFASTKIPYLISMTGCVRKEDQDICMSLGFNDCISKPFVYDNIKQVMDIYIKRNSTFLNFQA